MVQARFRLVATALLAAVAPASAGVVATAALPLDFAANQRAMCAVANTGTKVLSAVEIRIYEADDTVADSVQLPINPNSTQSVLASAAELGNTPFVRCEVEGSGIGKKTPVTLCVLPAAGADCVSVITAP